MAHVVYVDLSAKVEHWQTDNAVAVADGFAVTYLIPSAVKQQTDEEILVRAGKLRV